MASSVMARDRLTSVPNTITAGDTVEMTLAYADFSAANGGTLTFALAGAVVESWTATANGTGFDVTLADTETAALLTGLYQWRTRITEDGVTTTLDWGSLTVAPDLADVAAGDLVSYEAKLLPIVEEALLGTIQGEHRMLMVNGRQLQTFSPKELMALRDQLKANLAREANNGQLPPIRIGNWRRTDAVWTR